MLTGLVSLPFGKHDIANLITRLTVEQGDSCTRQTQVPTCHLTSLAGGHLSTERQQTSTSD